MFLFFFFFNVKRNFSNWDFQSVRDSCRRESQIHNIELQLKMLILHLKKLSKKVEWSFQLCEYSHLSSSLLSIKKKLHIPLKVACKMFYSKCLFFNQRNILSFINMNIVPK